MMVGVRVVNAWIKHDVYNEAVGKIGKEGVDRFVAAMKNGVVRAESQQGIKHIGLEGAEYELKVLAKKYANWRFYGNFDKTTQCIIFDRFGKALH